LCHCFTPFPNWANTENISSKNNETDGSTKKKTENHNQRTENSCIIRIWVRKEQIMDKNNNNNNKNDKVCSVLHCFGFYTPHIAADVAVAADV
jgi:hypothetical protein